MKWKNKKIAIVQGGPSPEREISLQTAQAVGRVLDKEPCSYFFVEGDKNFSQTLLEKKPDVVFLALHGLFGEDGCAQAVCELLRIPYTGSGILTSSLCMDKLFFKKFLVKNKIPIPDFKEADGRDNSFPFPVVVKSSHGGSTLGTYIVKTKKSLKQAIKKARDFGGVSVFMEQFIPEGKEIAVSFLAGRILTPLEIVPKGGLYDFKRKYTKGETRYVIPPRLDPSVIERIKVLSKKVINLTGVRGYGRLDFLIAKNNQPWLLEVNTLPGLTETSLLPKSANYDGISFSQVIKTILEKAQTDYSL